MAHYRRTGKRRQRAAVLRIVKDWNVKPWHPPRVENGWVHIMVAGAEVSVPISSGCALPCAPSQAKDQT